MNKTLIGEKLKRIRKANNYSRAELAEKVGLNANRIQQYENGVRNPRPELIRQFAEALNVSPYALKEPNISIPVGLMYRLFDLEEYQNLQLKKIDEEPCMFFDNEDINSLLQLWYERYMNYIDDISLADTKEEKDHIENEYYLWKCHFPESAYLDNQQKIKNIKERISRLKKKLESLD